MTNRCNPQFNANMVDRYIGSAFDIVYSVYKELDNLAIIHQFAKDYLPELTRLEEEKVDKIEGMGLSSNDFTQAFIDQLNSLEQAIQDLNIRVANIEQTLNP